MNNSDAFGYPGLVNQTDRDWLEQLENYAEEEGYFEPLGKNHAAAFFDRSTTLLVTFETCQEAQKRRDAVPAALSLNADKDWSRLCVVASEHSWFRDKRVYGYFDRLVDDGFFEDFDRVVFYGSGMCGYAAAAFSVASPGAVVLAVQPQATLDPDRTRWDRRFMDQRRLCFTDRYGFAPDMIDAAAAVQVLFDQDSNLDSMHASLFGGDEHVSLIPTRFMGSDLAGALERSGALELIIDNACHIDPDDEENLATRLAVESRGALRTRRVFPPYLRRVFSHLDRHDRAGLMHRLCRYAVNIPESNGIFRDRLEDLDREQAENQNLPVDG